MKGVVFTEFLEMVEATFGLTVLDQIIQGSSLSTGAVYTGVGTYDHRELLQLVTQLSSVTNMPVPDLVRAFGRHLFGRFAQGYSQFFQGIHSTFDFVSTIENHIHVEVRKLYPDAELPSFECRRAGPDRLEMIYRSSRPFADLAYGLIEGCAAHFGEDLRIDQRNTSSGTNYEVRFSILKKLAAAA